nr:hypothetical protein [Desulfobacterales bacterium]
MTYDHQKVHTLNRFYIFVLRIILGVIFAVLITRIFYPKASIVGIVAVLVFLVGMAYLIEYFRMHQK